ncbi:MAG: hypothetical protein IPL61_12540 [Myxococcales bacterium]|nr:hypothetical protein [Myxococcales bacterium]
MTPATTVEITASDLPALAAQTFASLGDAERAIAAAWAQVPEREPRTEHFVRYQLTWPDGWRFAGMVELRRSDIARPGFLVVHLHHAARTLSRPTRSASLQATGAALRAHLPAEHAVRNSVASPPPLARVEITWSENARVRPRTYRSLAAADRALAAAFAHAPPPEGGGYDKTAFVVVWTDGAAHEGRADVRRVDLGTAPGNGGILRQHLQQVATWLRDQAATWTAWSPEERLARAAWGADLLRRLEAEPPLAAAPARSVHRNADELQVTDAALLAVGTTTAIPGVSLLPDPLATLAALEAHFATARPLATAAGHRIPVTTNRDVTLAANWLSLALAHDLAPLRDLTGRPQGALWDRWARAVEHIRHHQGADADAAYPDNPGFWGQQAPHLARTIARALTRAHDARGPS